MADATLAKCDSAEDFAAFVFKTASVLAAGARLLPGQMAARAAAKSVSVAFPDVTIIVNAKDQSAVADVTLQAQVAGEADVIVQEL
ncbi:MAG TPA: hypothetical protein VGO59_19835, partial [Verrucomicrobiae bacterium]